MNSFHVCMNSSCLCKWFEIAKSSKLIKIFPLHIQIFRFVLHSFLHREEKVQLKTLLLATESIYCFNSLSIPRQWHQHQHFADFYSNSQAELHAHRYASHNTTCFLTICSRFIGAVTGPNARKDLLSVTYNATYNPQENELFKTQLNSFMSCLPVWKLKTQRRTHTGFFISENCRNIHKKKNSLYKNKPKIADATLHRVTETRTMGDAPLLSSPPSYTETIFCT